MLRNFYKYSIHYWAIFLVLFVLFIRALSIKEYRDADIRKAVIIDKLYGVTHGRRGGGSEYYYPQFQFPYKDTSYINADASFDFRGYTIGDTIRIHFPKGVPEQSAIYTFETFWLRHVGLFYFIFIGAFIFVIPRIIAAPYFNAKERRVRRW